MAAACPRELRLIRFLEIYIIYSLGRSSPPGTSTMPAEHEKKKRGGAKINQWPYAFTYKAKGCVMSNLNARSSSSPLSLSTFASCSDGCPHPRSCTSLAALAGHLSAAGDARAARVGRAVCLCDHAGPMHHIICMVFLQLLYWRLVG